MAYTKKDTKGAYVEQKNGVKRYLVPQAKYVPIDRSKPKNQRNGLG